MNKHPDPNVIARFEKKYREEHPPEEQRLRRNTLDGTYLNMVTAKLFEEFLAEEQVAAPKKPGGWRINWARPTVGQLHRSDLGDKGWDIFDVDGDPRKQQIQKVDDVGFFTSDLEAIGYVFLCAMNGDPCAIDAIHACFGIEVAPKRK